MPGYYKGAGYLSKRDEQAYCGCCGIIIALAVLAFLAYFLTWVGILGVAIAIAVLIFKRNLPLAAKIFAWSIALLVLGIIGGVVRTEFAG